MNYIPQEIERKILEYDDDYKHMFICKSWFNVIKEKYNIKKELATTLYKELGDFNKNDNNTKILTAHFNKYYPIQRYIPYTIDYLLKRLLHKIPMHLYCYRMVGGEIIEEWDYNEYLQFKILKKNVNKILNKVLKYKVRLHSKNYKYTLQTPNEFKKFSYFELIMW
tara:strand:+ start:345 stop:842 length:498 start_codon:yes stop_codon:yes gene_type:complete